MFSMKKIKIAYIGGGSKEWARVFMSDLTLTADLSGDIFLYDIDTEAALRNKAIGEALNKHPNAKTSWNYTVETSLEKTLTKADFVIISILPGTFSEMESDVHEPEKYGIFQSVGDTVGPGGVLRAMRTVPLYEEFAKNIKKYCPKAWVLNLTNPMSICVKTLYDVFPEIKAFGCCHEVFHTQDLLCCVLKEELGIEATRKEITTSISGINHFTWITSASYKDKDLLPLFEQFMQKHYKEGFYEGGEKNLYKTNPFAYGNRVKMHLYQTYKTLPTGGDRHIVEFLNKNWYLSSPATVDFWHFALTTVAYRKEKQAEKIADSLAMAQGKKPVVLEKSQEEVVDLMQALLGMKELISNVNIPNYGQMQEFPLGSIVETNAFFHYDEIIPLHANPLPLGPRSLVTRNLQNSETLYQGIKKRDFQIIFQSFMNQPLCSELTIEEGKTLFIKMVQNTKHYLEDFYNLDILTSL